jgi:hypothetical protein
MADPRKRVDFSGIGQKRATFAYGNTIVWDAANPTKYDGLAVILVSDDTVQLVDDDDEIFGFISLIEQDGYCSVIYDGVNEIAKAGTAAATTPGLGVVGALRAGAKGYVKEGAPGRGFILNNNDADKIVVLLTR